MKKAHLIGIGGIGMSALANLMLAKNYTLSGSDAGGASDLTLELENKGVKISYSHSEQNLQEDCQLVVYSQAIPATNPERELATKKGIKQLSYAEALGELTGDHKLVLVTGTHGKTTVTGMISHILLEEDADPSIIIGSKMPLLDGRNYRIGNSNLCIIEGCEYRRSFLNFRPQILVINNLELDHLDYFEDEKDYLSAFAELIARMPEDGIVIINEDDEKAQNLVKDIKQNVIEFSSREAEQIELMIPGKHNRLNAAAALKALEALEINGSSKIKTFKGTWRRLELIGQKEGTLLYDDYAHHPTEIKATLQALREKYPNEKICAVFQPHQVSRTKAFINEFAKAFTDAIQVLVSEIYSVRDSEEEQKQTSPDELVTQIEKTGVAAKNSGTLEETKNYLKENLNNWDVIVLMGAGSITKIRTEIL